MIGSNDSESLPYQTISEVNLPAIAPIRNALTKPISIISSSEKMCYVAQPLGIPLA